MSSRLIAQMKADSSRAIAVAITVRRLPFRSSERKRRYLGLVPSESSTGDKVKRGGITKAGNGRARRILVEAAWSYRYPPRVSRDKQSKVEAAPRRVREMAAASLDLIEAMRVIAEAAQPITGRGVGYKLFTQGLIPSMSRSSMQRVYRLLVIAREEGTIDWDWIVDETRGLERVATWDDPAQFSRAVARSYRRDFWNQQPHRVQVWSEKGTVRGLLAPVLDEYAVGFNPVHGFGSATEVHNLAEDDDGRDLIILYVGDYDPSGMFMSEVDLPARLERYEGYHATLRRIALIEPQTRGLPSFPASDKGPKPGKKGDSRYKWFVANYGDECWELDAMDPNELRDCVEREIKALIEPVAWARCEVVNRAEQESLRTVLDGWPTRSKT